MKLKRWLFLWGPAILWCGVIFGFSSIPTPPKVGFIWWDFLIKKSAHITEYAILFFLIWRAIRNSFKLQVVRPKLFLGILFFCLFYAISDEFHQSFVMGRTPTVRDVGFDLTGMVLAWYAIKKNWLPPKLYA
jgi:VanZ family protein